MVDMLKMAKETPSEFSFGTVKKKPTRVYKKGSKYDPILDAFMKDERKLVSVTMPSLTGNNIRTQLDKRIKALPDRFKGIEVSVVNETCYLEKV